MVNKILTSLFFVELIIALSIAVYWTNNNIEFHTIKIGGEFLSFLNTTSSQLNNNRFEIPNIPNIPNIEFMDTNDNANWWEGILNFFVNFANGFFMFLNGVINILNFLITIVNYVIQLAQFIVLLIGNLFNMIGKLQSQPA